MSSKTAVVAPVAEKAAPSVSFDYTALLSDDPTARSKVEEALKTELGSAQATIESATKRCARLQALLGTFTADGNSAPAEKPAKKSKEPKEPKTEPVSKGDATKAEVMKALKAGDAKGMTSAAIRSACGGKKNSVAVAALIEDGKIERLPGGHGAGVSVRLCNK